MDMGIVKTADEAMKLLRSVLDGIEMIVAQGIKRKQSPALHARTLGAIKPLGEIGHSPGGLIQRGRTDTVRSYAIGQTICVLQSQSAHK